MPKIKPPFNKILAALPAEHIDQVFSKLHAVPLTFGDRIHWADEPIEEMYFPESGIISLLSSTHDSSYIEVGLLGCEGVVGFNVALGVNVSAVSAVVQGSGTGHKMSALDFEQLSETIPLLKKGALRFIHGLITQTALAAACNAFHPTDRRLARWLLMMHDRVNTDEFQITQEFLSQMLGVRREAVTRSAGELSSLGLIEHSRGKITIKDRARLESTSCSCYAEIAAAYTDIS